MSKNLKHPFDLIAEVLEINRDLINENSALGETPNWESLNHLKIICELEINYGIKIPNEDIEMYVTMDKIIKLYETQLEKLQSNR